jgi:hypothetical protein
MKSLAVRHPKKSGSSQASPDGFDLPLAYMTLIEAYIRVRCERRDVPQETSLRSITGKTQDEKTALQSSRT